MTHHTPIIEDAAIDYEASEQDAAACIGEIRSILAAHHAGTDSPEWAHADLVSAALEMLEGLEGHPAHTAWKVRVHREMQLVTCPACGGQASWSGVDSYDRDVDWDCPACEGVGIVTVDQAAEIEREMEDERLEAEMMRAEHREMVAAESRSLHDWDEIPF